MENKAINTKVDNEADDRRKEIAAMKTQIQQQRDEIRGQQESDTAMVLKQLEKDSGKGTKALQKFQTEEIKEVCTGTAPSSDEFLSRI